MLNTEILRFVQNMTSRCLVRPRLVCALSTSKPYALRTAHYALRSTHHAVARGTPARGGYPLHSPLSYYSTHRSPRMRIHLHSALPIPHSGRLPTHDPMSCRHYQLLGTPYSVLGASAGATAMARDHGSIALYARYARPRGHLFFPYVPTLAMPKKGE